jgi:hypothetical protein
MAVKPLRATLPDLSSPQGRPCLAGVANYTPLARQRIATFPLPLTKAWHRISLPLSPRVSGARHLWTQLFPPKGRLPPFPSICPDMPFTATSRIESLAPYSVRYHLQWQRAFP